MTFMQKFTRKSKLIFVSALIAVGLSTTAVLAATPAKVNAAACDKVNIVHCGLDGSSTQGYINSLESFYNKGSDNGHNDLKAVYNWAGWSTSDINGMTTSNTKKGYLHRDGTIVVGGKVVATDAWVSARFTEGKGFVKIKDGVWARKTTTSLKYDAYVVLVHFNADGTFDTAVMVECGNAVKATNKVKATPPPAKAALACTSLKASATADPRTFRLTATATSSNTTIQTYVFKFNDGTEKVVRTSSRSASTTQQFAAYSKTYTATAYVNSGDIKNRTASACVVRITTPPAPTQPALVCKSLTRTEIIGQPLTYRFVAQAVPVDTTITSYEFNFGDGTNESVVSGENQATAEHTYTANNTNYVATVTVNSTKVSDVTSTTCRVAFTTPAVEECKPGVPVGSAECEEQPVVEEEPIVEEEPDELVNAGPGSIAGLFAGTSLLGALGHRFYKKRISRN